MIFKDLGYSMLCHFINMKCMQLKSYLFSLNRFFIPAWTVTSCNTYNKFLTNIGQICSKGQKSSTKIILIESGGNFSSCENYHQQVLHFLILVKNLYLENRVDHQSWALIVNQLYHFYINLILAIATPVEKKSSTVVK